MTQLVAVGQCYPLCCCVLEQQRVADANRLNKLIRKATDVVTLEHVFLDNGSNPSMTWWSATGVHSVLELSHHRVLQEILPAYGHQTVPVLTLSVRQSESKGGIGMICFSLVFCIELTNQIICNHYNK